MAVQNVGRVSLWTIKYPISQRPPTSAEYARLGRVTGISEASLKAQPAELLNIFGQSTVIDYALPAGVEVKAFLETTNDGVGWISFNSTNSAALALVFERLGSGITVDQAVGQFSGSTTQTYRMRFTRSGMTITGITP